VLANLNPFRGAEPDSGTCVEIGYALALGKPVIGYAADLRPLRERLHASGPGADGRYRDGAGMVVEDFGLPLNLMLAVPVQLVQGGPPAGGRIRWSPCAAPSPRKMPSGLRRESRPPARRRWMHRSRVGRCVPKPASFP
jgi:hypothetical protein